MDRIEFTVNGVKCSVGSEVSSDTSLNEYLRSHLNLRGVKYMCKEGGCGACVVTVTTTDLDTGSMSTFSVNSCLVSITSCKDWEITTIEEIGNRNKGYHAVQKNLAKHNGTQCGYCTPGWVMSMYSLLEGKESMTMKEIEKSFGSNTCRCTGYRSILEAFKEFATDGPISNKIVDIEDLSKLFNRNVVTQECKQQTCFIDEDWCLINKNMIKEEKVLKVILKDNKRWYRVNEVKDIFNIFDKEGLDSYMLVAGNTAKGAFPIDDYPNVLIDISGVLSLHGYEIEQNLIIKGATTISTCADIFEKLSREKDGFEYLNKFYSHLELVAHYPVKNIGTVAGNLMIKHEHQTFQSDIFLLFETVGAILTLQNKEGEQKVSVKDFLTTDMKGKVIINVLIPPLSKECKFVSYKIMPRSQNAAAIVNAAFLYHIKDKKTVTKASIVIGGLSEKFIHAKKTEKYILGKNIFTNEVLQEALKVLENELIVEPNPPEPSVEFRKKLALGLFYKGLLDLCPSSTLGDKYRSGSINLRTSRPLSHGSQVYDTNKAVWPLNQPMPKVEALIQCSGEAPYMEDIPTLPGEVFAAFVLSTVTVGEIDEIDASPAMNMDGVIAFYTAKDIPGLNSFTPIDLYLNFIHEEVLCDGKVKFFNQPIGIIVAESEKLANKAAKKVIVTYKNTKSPVLNIAQARKHVERTSLIYTLPASNTGLKVKKVINGSSNTKAQCYYSMETQVCVTKPSDDGLEVNSSTQWMDMVQMAISQALKIEQNRINLAVRRLGGGFGGKISRSTQIAVACSLVTFYLNRPCRFITPLTTFMRAIGKRFPCSSDFEVKVSSTGEIQSLLLQVYEDNGYTINEPVALVAASAINNCYDKKRWNIKVFNIITDTAKNSACRSPGILEQIAMSEIMMEQISYEMSLDPIKVRQANFIDEKGISEVVDKLIQEAEYEKRKNEIANFNQNNNWTKRGLRFAPLKFPIPALANFGVTLTVYHGDGSVVITHGGIEMGQGINTKVVQVCAYTLNLPIDKIKVKSSNVITNPNSTVTGFSFSSEAVCLGVIKCCQILLERLAPIKANLNVDTWEILIKTAYSKGINLLTSYNVTSTDQKEYFVYGATLTEVEVDMLTGEFNVLRVDIMEDVGQSLSPEIDVGQIEGAFIMGLGYWTCEDIVYDATTGEVLTDRSWNYHVPLAKDIPVDFRIYFKRNSYNENGVLGSKATGEPAICMSISVSFAIREAIAAARADKGIPTTQWFDIDGPCTTEKIVMSADTRIEDFKFY